MTKEIKVVLKVVLINIYKVKEMAKQKNKRTVIQKVINNHLKSNKKEISQLTIKIDKRLDNALIVLSQSLNISKNRLIEDILCESGIIQEVDENYIGEDNE
ncbi:hypothetical protein ACOJTA_04750 [Malaciobacter sp. WC5094]